MGVQERRAREKQELRQEIIEAARDMFVREGFDSLSMRKIAERIEYSPTTIYLYFEDKADLLDCVCEATFQKLATRLAAIESSTTDPLKYLVEGLRAYVDFGLTHPSDYRVAFLSEIRDDQETGSYPRCHAMGQKLFDHLQRAVSECMRLGIFATCDVDAASQALWASVHGLTSLLILHPGFPWRDRTTLLECLIRTYLEGLKHPAPEGRP